MRVLWILCLLAGSARADALWEAELRIGYGVVMAGSNAGTMTTRGSPIGLAAIVSAAVREEPRLYAVGGLVAEALDRNAIGAMAGVRVEPADRPWRLGAGGTYLVAPYTLWGAVASVGGCRRAAISVCGDLQLTAYFAGSDLPASRTVTQVQAVLGVVFDVL